MLCMQTVSGSSGVQAGMVVTSAVTWHLIPRLPRAPISRPQVKERYWEGRGREEGEGRSEPLTHRALKLLACGSLSVRAPCTGCPARGGPAV